MKSRISSSIFFQNTAHYGGAISIDGLTDTRILDSNFTKNHAVYYNDTIGTGNGGAVLYTCPLIFLTCNLDVQRSTFLSNAAEMDGGAIKFTASPIILDSITEFVSNYAIYGHDVASYPIHLFKVDSMDIDAVIHVYLYPSISPPPPARCRSSKVLKHSKKVFRN